MMLFDFGHDPLQQLEIARFLHDPALVNLYGLSRPGERSQPVGRQREPLSCGGDIDTVCAGFREQLLEHLGRVPRGSGF